jgi:hypothetical protein
MEKFFIFDYVGEITKCTKKWLESVGYRAGTAPQKDEIYGQVTFRYITSFTFPFYRKDLQTRPLNRFVRMCIIDTLVTLMKSFPTY